MSFVNVKNYFINKGIEGKLKVLGKSCATVELAAKALKCNTKQIAKTMTFFVQDKPIMIVCAGDVKVNNSKFKSKFNEKAKMIPRDLVNEKVGHDVGGVCPFAVKEEVKIYLDESLKGNSVVYPAAGDEHSVVELTIDELEKYTYFVEWIDVCS